MKHLLLQIIEWHAQSLHDWHYDTWHDGRFIEHWADPRALRGLGGAFAHYDQDDICRALLTTMDLFRWLAIETAQHSSLPYPTLADKAATGLVSTLFAGKTQMDSRESAERFWAS